MPVTRQMSLQSSRAALWTTMGSSWATHIVATSVPVKAETAWAVEDAELAGDGLSLGPAAGNPGRVAPCWQHGEHGAQNKNMARNRYAPYPR